MGPRRTVAAGAAAALTLLVVLLVVRPARAVDVGHVKGEPVQLDVTETTIVAQHFDARTPPNQAYPPVDAFENSGWGSWLNRLNASLRWDRFTAGLRLDSAVYWNRPIDNPGAAPYNAAIAPGQIGLDNESRFRNSVYPAKTWVTYAAPGVEVTAGDAYVQFGRGLTLSMRKIDELGIDTTVRGAKVQLTRDPYSLTAVAGFANPSRVDEATGRALWVTSDPRNMDPPSAVFGSDRVAGVDFQAGRGLPVTLSSHLVHFTRCAPFAYDGNGMLSGYGAEQTTFTFGSCDSSDVDTWLQSLNTVPRGLQARDITMVGQSIEIPTLWGHGKLYVEGAVQQRSRVGTDVGGPNGNALYAALTLNFGPTSTTIEGKSNRNFYTVAGSVSKSAPELSLAAYTFLPPAESFNMIDAEGTGDFNACVEGIRVREDVSVNKDLIVYGQGISAYSLTEQPNGACDEMGRTKTSFNYPAAKVQDTVWDGVTGFEYSFDRDLSHLFVSTGARTDTLADGESQYMEQHAEYSFAKFLGGPWSIEVQGRYRHRRELGFNLDPMGTPAWWTEAENYVAVRIVPKWVFTQGIETTNLIGQPTLYFNGAVTYKLTSSSNVRVFVGQQRGAFRCASGVCRYFPPFEGARAELTLRF